MTKAFDLVKFSVLFKKLVEKNLPLIFIRLLIFMYMNQSANVRWNGDISKQFSISNGVKQGMVLSALLYCIYCSQLMVRLREKRTGCWINCDYLGILSYSDDNLLLSPSLDGLQDMLKTCEDYAREHNLTFSTHLSPRKSKTKCLSFLHKKRPLRQLQLCGNNLPWVDSALHVGNKITDDMNGMKQDIREKRARYIQKNNEICQEFHFAHPKTKFQINSIWNCHFSGCQIWDLFCKESEMVEASYNQSFKVMFDLPWATKRFFVETISESIHIKKQFIKRFLQFTKQILESPKIAIKNVFNLVRHNCLSVTGSNLRNIMLLVQKTSILDLVPEDAYKVVYHEMPENEAWRVGFVTEITDVKFGEATIEGFSRKELNVILDSICTT